VKAGSPRGLNAAQWLAAALVAAFLLTAPWRIAGRDVGRLSVCLGAAAAVLLLTLLSRGWRQEWARRLREGTAALSGRALAVASLVAAAALGRIVFARYLSLDLSAWDTTLFFDHPIAATLSKGLLFCPTTGTSYLGTHASYVLLALVPLYALAASPFWLLAAHAAAVAAGAAAGFLVFRRILGDDLAARLLAVAFLLNGYTARTVQYGFHPEALYPLAVFVLWLGLLDDRPRLLVLGSLLALSIKEDALLVLLGLAAASALFLRKRRAGAVVATAAILAFLVSTRLVMPHYSGALPERPWYASYWASWGDSLPAVALAMLAHPLRLARTLLASGAPGLMEPLLLLPLAGPEALVAALPALVPYAAADFRQLREFALYYAMPVLPFLFLGVAYGMRRLLVTPRARRLAALAVLCACAFDGASYTIRRPHPARHEIGPALEALGNRPVRVQGSLFPHAGYQANRRVLDRQRPLAPGEAVLLCPGTDAFPFSDRELSAIGRRLAAGGDYVRTVTPGGLVLFRPRS
jgi:uncharacterized membrane protein